MPRGQEKILILDQATSSVDSHSEQLIQKAITNIRKNMTSISIAHRLSSIRHADQIIALDQGITRLYFRLVIE